MNNLLTSGRLGRDAELRSTASGRSVLSFSIANTTRFGGQEKTTWMDCVLWGERGEKLAEYLTKGSHVLLDGRISKRSYEGRDGSKRTSVELVVNDLEFLGSRRNSEERPQQEQSQFADQDIPF